MKHLLLVITLLCCSLNCNAQTDSTLVNKPTYSVRPGFVNAEMEREIKELEAFRQRHLYQAGNALQNSSFCMGMSLGASVVSGLMFGLGGATDNSGARTGLFVGGGIFGVATLAFTIATIHFHNKAGRELRLSAGEVVYKF